MREEKKINLLIVDDNKEMTRSLKSEINARYKQITVETASGGNEALRRVNQGGIDAVLTDIAMPDMDGCTLYLRIMETHPEIHVMMISAFYDPSHIAYNARLKGLKDLVPDLVLVPKREMAEILYKKIEEHFLK
jgi:YesN/AraC family two-component response regulator